MSHDHDPPRFLEEGSEAPPELRELFQQARGDLPLPEQLARLAAALEPLGASAPKGTGRQIPASLPPKALLGILGGLLVLGGAGAWLWLSQPDLPETQRSPAERSAAEAAPVDPPSAPRAETQTPAAPVDPHDTSADGASADHDQVASPDARPVPVAPRPRSAGRTPSEAELLEAARSALAADPTRALRLTREHARRYPGGMLAQEREVIAIEALRRIGQARAAEQRATEFQKDYPGSAHERTIDPKSR